MQGSYYFVRFRKDGRADLGPIPVIINPVSHKDETNQHVLVYDYEVGWDDDYGFTKNEDGDKIPFERIDSSCFIVWDQLPKPAELNHPTRHPQGRFATALFTSKAN